MSLSILLDNSPLLFVLLVNTILAILVWKANPRSPVNRWFTAVIATICLWIISLFFLYTRELDQSIVFWGRVAFGSTYALGLFFWLFAYHFPSTSIPIKKQHIQLFVAAAALPIALSCTPLIIKTVGLVRGDPFPTYGILFLYSLITFLTSLVFAFILLIKKYQKEKGYARDQLLYIFWGFACTIILALLTNLIIPTLTGNSASARFGPVATLVLIAAATYSIVRYRFLDIDFIIRRGLIYSLLLASTFLLFSSVVIWLPNLLLGQARTITLTDIATLLTLTLLVAPLQRFFEKITDKYFFKARYDTQYTIYELGKKLSGIVGIAELEQSIVTTLCEVMKIKGMAVLRITDGNHFVWGYSAGLSSPNTFKISELRHITLEIRHADNILVIDEAKRIALASGHTTAHWIDHLEAQKIALITPLISKGQLVGALFVGRKRSEDAFTSQDIELLDILAHQAAVAFDNAMLYSTLEKRVQDRTELLEEANKHLLQLDKAKNEFLSIASHQLRTPLSAIRGYLSMILDGDYGEITEKQQGVLTKTTDNVRRLVSLVNDLLSLARIEAGTGPKGLNIEEVDMSAMVDMIVEELTIKAKAKGLTIIWHKPETPVIAEIDREKIEQVVMNLIDNAVHYTLTGTITIKIEEDKKHVIYSVQDTGIGIDRESMDNLFAKFYRAQDAIKVRPDGTGIGLYLCKIITEAHLGRIWVESKPGEGSKFSVELQKQARKQ